MYLIRHGATANNLAKPPVLQGSTLDGPLSEEGHRQSSRLAELLQEAPLGALFSSPLQRARQTADSVNRFHDLDVQIVADLTEVDVGEWEGRSWVHIEQEDPESYRRFMEDPENFGYLGGESLTDVASRVIPAFDRLLRSHLGHEIAVVAHNMVNRTLLAHLLDMPLNRARTLSQHNCGVNIIRYRKEESSVVTLNSGFHLGR